MPTCMTGPAPSTRILDSGGAPLATIQDFPDMDPDIDQGTPIIILIPAFHPADRILVSVDRAPVLRLQLMHRHECSGDRTRCEDLSVAVH